jgi:hypothetical protein
MSNSIRLNDVSAWINHGKEKGYIDFLKEKEWKPEVDKIEEQWETAVLYNVDNPTWNRIKNALMALKK